MTHTKKSFVPLYVLFLNKERKMKTSNVKMNTIVYQTEKKPDLFHLFPPCLLY